MNLKKTPAVQKTERGKTMARTQPEVKGQTLTRLISLNRLPVCFLTCRVQRHSDGESVIRHMKMKCVCFQSEHPLITQFVSQSAPMSLQQQNVCDGGGDFAHQVSAETLTFTSCTSRRLMMMSSCEGWTGFFFTFINLWELNEQQCAASCS